NAWTYILSHDRCPFLSRTHGLSPSRWTRKAPRKDLCRTETAGRLTHCSRRDDVETISLWSYRDGPLVPCQAEVHRHALEDSAPGWNGARCVRLVPSTYHHEALFALFWRNQWTLREYARPLAAHGSRWSFRPRRSPGRTVPCAGSFAP